MGFHYHDTLYYFHPFVFRIVKAVSYFYTNTRAGCTLVDNDLASNFFTLQKYQERYYPSLGSLWVWFVETRSTSCCRISVTVVSGGLSTFTVNRKVISNWRCCYLLDLQQYFISFSPVFFVCATYLSFLCRPFQCHFSYLALKVGDWSDYWDFWCLMKLKIFVKTSCFIYFDQL